MTPLVSRSDPVPEAVEEILRDLPEWFGIEDALSGYVEQARVLPTYTAVEDDDVVGVCLIEQHTSYAAEVHLLAVKRAMHRRRIGHALMAAAESDLRRAGVEFVQVKTLGAEHPSPEYAATRAFYEALGFRALEEFEEDTIWPGNPCLLMVKALSTADRRPADP